MFGTHVRVKFIVALSFVFLFHFTYRLASWPYGRDELPCALGASPASEAFFFDPYHLPTHRRIIGTDSSHVK
jgi:hypothetical protein